MEWNKLVPELVVKDYSAAKKFYVHAFGFTLSFERENDGFGYFDLDGAQIMLLEDDKNHAVHTGNQIHFQVEIESVDELLARLENNNVELEKAPYEAWYQVDDTKHGHYEFFVRDLDGYLYRFFQDLGEKPI